MENTRISNLKKWLVEKKADIAYFNNPNHIAYYTGFSSDPHERILALFIPASGEPFLFTPALDVEEAQKSPWSYPIIGYLDSENPWDVLAKEIKQKYPTAKSFAIEKNSLPVANYEALKEKISDSSFATDLTPFMEKQLLIKTPAEKEKLLAAGHWADVALEIGFQAVKAGATELEIIAEIEYQLKKQGVTEMSFDTLVLAGDNAASPHGTPSKRAIKDNELVLFDLGVVWEGYCSDVSRTVAHKQPTALQEKIYHIVLEAQTAALEAIKPGITAAELDAVARDIISGYGYGEYFNHRLGHGIGTTVHEYPSIVNGNDLVIEEGMCFSIEPGIYLPGEVGVRIEDCLYVEKEGAVTFTKTDKKLKIIE